MMYNVTNRLKELLGAASTSEKKQLYRIIDAYMLNTSIRSLHAKLDSLVAAFTVSCKKHRLDTQTNLGQDLSSIKYADRACIFLDTDTNACKVYSDRPASCRSLVVSSDPEYCNTENKKRITKETSVKAEIINSAIMSMGVDTLPNQIQKLERLNR